MQPAEVKAGAVLARIANGLEMEYSLGLSKITIEAWLSKQCYIIEEIAFLEARQCGRLIKT
uniref:RH57246p n=1 Tax=Drosophila melanogaster TaxID=7227 RepID=Q8MYU2_DROME|nr:RH57246p [Drosophila melanogaster]